MSPDRQPGGAAPSPELVGLGRFPAVRRLALEPWLERVLAEVAPSAGTLAVRFVGDRSMRRLNRDFRSRDATTDVLSFPGGETPEGPHLGDVVVSVPRAKAQADAAGHSLERELRGLLLHGVLHCLGHDHERDDGEMERLEQRLRRRYLNDA